MAVTAGAGVGVWVGTLVSVRIGVFVAKSVGVGRPVVGVGVALALLAGVGVALALLAEFEVGVGVGTPAGVDLGLNGFVLAVGVFVAWGPASACCTGHNGSRPADTAIGPNVSNVRPAKSSRRLLPCPFILGQIISRP